MPFPALPVPIDGMELFLLVTLSGIVTGTWIYIDARRRSVDHAAIWAVAVGFLIFFYFVVGLAGLVIYLLVRNHDRVQSSEETVSTETNVDSVD